MSNVKQLNAKRLDENQRIINKLDELTLHEDMNIDFETRVMRVYKGLIYTFRDNQGLVISSTFIPFE